MISYFNVNSDKMGAGANTVLPLPSLQSGENADLTVYLINLDIWQFGPHGYFVQEVDSVELNF
jgi:hypothetical protein